MSQLRGGSGKVTSPKGGARKGAKLTPRQRDLARKLKKVNWKPTFEQAMKWFEER